MCMAVASAPVSAAPARAVRSAPCVTNVVGSRNVFDVELTGRSISGVMSRSLPFRAGAPVVKVVWSVDGDGPLGVALFGPSGDRSAPTWGPKRHGAAGSEIDEWGTGISFARPGCWRVVLSRSGSQAVVTIAVV